MRSGGDGEKIEWKLTEVNTRVVSEGHNKLKGKLKMGVTDVISIEG
jgi:hypothetical protein